MLSTTIRSATNQESQGAYPPSNNVTDPAHESTQYPWEFGWDTLGLSQLDGIPRGLDLSYDYGGEFDFDFHLNDLSVPPPDSTPSLSNILEEENERPEATAEWKGNRSNDRNNGLSRP